MRRVSSRMTALMEFYLDAFRDSLRDFAVVRGNLLTQAGKDLSDACTVDRIGFGAIGDVPLLNVLGSSADLARRKIEQSLALLLMPLSSESPVAIRGAVSARSHLRRTFDRCVVAHFIARVDIAPEFPSGGLDCHAFAIARKHVARLPMSRRNPGDDLFGLPGRLEVAIPIGKSHDTFTVGNVDPSWVRSEWKECDPIGSPQSSRKNHASRRFVDAGGSP